MEKFQDVYMTDLEWIQRRHDKRYVKKLLTYVTRHKVVSWEVKGSLKFTNIVVSEPISDKQYEKLSLTFGRVNEPIDDVE